MDRTNFVLCGLGGQGILFMTKVLAECALHKGLKVMGAETHGMAQRGGSVVSHLRLGDVKGSLVRTGSAHFVLALDEIEGYRNLPFLSPGARLYINADPRKGLRKEVTDYLERQGILFRAVPATAIAGECNAPLSTNLALLGYFAAYEEDPLSEEELRQTVERISPDRFKETNLRVFAGGLGRGREEAGR
ncbi:MAG: indolepyruvate oxidoreductase subunit beta [Deltaproteobacteria bacterium]|nr:indolepyruvate oxidoreductase subunit beta [Deltaproteobacteria bacterium]MBW2015638.1 indolepyruvate oxidoreductase subunit beta [Deltaproteobacteria bacterium]MBW2129783.1 indolepyruvate oxidoreductase subunit beta [Deltaproteobacteria bacterium]MBW2302499.1 indolepyruvate oxidoreductase subunit beta [Deltaproteobacteria bacterium]